MAAVTPSSPASSAPVSESMLCAMGEGGSVELREAVKVTPEKEEMGWNAKPKEGRVMMFSEEAGRRESERSSREERILGGR